MWGQSDGSIVASIHTTYHILIRNHSLIAIKRAPTGISFKVASRISYHDLMLCALRTSVVTSRRPGE